MTLSLRRRDAGLGLVAAVAACRATASPADAAVEGRIQEIERALGGRIGAAMTRKGRQLGYRGDEPFPLCSTFKLLAAGLVLSRVDRDEERLERRVVFGPGDLVAYSPVTEKRIGQGDMSLAEICEAAITRSDNTAGNLLLASFGGPPALTAFARRLGDPATRLDRTETTLNEALPGDPRDTTTPLAMLGTMRRLVLGEALSPASRQQLRDWLLANQTGAARIRAGTPAGWRVGDKTGTGERGAACDIAVLWPIPDGEPLALTVYTHGSTRPLSDINAAIAEVAGIMIAAAGDW